MSHEILSRVVSKTLHFDKNFSCIERYCLAQCVSSLHTGHQDALKTTTLVQCLHQQQIDHFLNFARSIVASVGIDLSLIDI